MKGFPTGKRCALLLAHPGHELVVHRFVETAKPVVAILTDGSGGSGRSRVDSTTRFLEPAGARPTALYARYSDQRCYTALLEGDGDFFIGIAEDLASMLLGQNIDAVIGDASEGWNPIHDIWRGVINLAVTLATTRGRGVILNFDFLLFASHKTAAACSTPDSVLLQLDEGSYQRKIKTATLYSELHAEVQAALRGSTEGLVSSRDLSRALDERLGELNAEAYRFELLRAVKEHPPSRDPNPRVYELYGEMVVAEGRYQEAIRYDRHVLPIEKAIQRYGLRETGSRSLCASSSPTTI